MNNDETLLNLKRIYGRLIEEKSFESEAKAAEWLSQAIPFLKRLNNSLYYNEFKNDFNYLNRGLTSHTTEPAYNRLKNTLLMAIQELELTNNKNKIEASLRPVDAENNTTDKNQKNFILSLFYRFGRWIRDHIIIKTFTIVITTILSGWLLSVIAKHYKF